MEVAKSRKKTFKYLKVAPRSSLGSTVPSALPSNDLYDKKVLKAILKHFSKERKKRTSLKKTCPVEEATEGRVDRQVKLRCRQLTNVVQELRKAIMRHDWDEATTLLMILCHPGLTYYKSVIFRACFILLCNHPNSSLDLVRNFIRNTTQYVVEENVNKFIRILFALRKSVVEPLSSGKYERTSGDYRIVRDPEFENL